MKKKKNQADAYRQLQPDVEICGQWRQLLQLAASVFKMPVSQLLLLLHQESTVRWSHQTPSPLVSLSGLRCSISRRSRISSPDAGRGFEWTVWGERSCCTCCGGPMVVQKTPNSSRHSRGWGSATKQPSAKHHKNHENHFWRRHFWEMKLF